MQMRILKVKTNLLLATLAAVCLHGAPVAEAAGGLRLDQAFGHHGIGEHKLGPAYGSTQYVSAHVNPDGSVLAARHEGQNGDEVVTVRRYDPGGEPEGTVETHYELSAPEVVDAEGRYVIGAGSYVVRLLADGTPDPTFGKVDSYDRRMSDLIPCHVEAVLPLPSGQVMAGGAQCLARLDQDGKLDKSFGDRGAAMLHPLGIAGWRLELVGIAPGAGGNLILALNRFRSAGYGEQTIPDGSLVVAITPTAGLDSTWGQRGLIDSKMTIGAISPTPDGGVLLAGERWGRQLDKVKAASDALLVRLGPDGAQSTGFGSGGTAALDIGGVDLVNAMTVQPDDGIVIAGAATRLSFVCTEYWEQFCDETPFVARFRADGSSDAAYGEGGVSELSPLTASFAPIEGMGVLGLSPRPDGGVLAWGGAGINAFMAALGPGGGLDRTFGDAGIRVEQRQGRSSANAHVLGIDRRGRILVLGGTNSGVAPGALFRFLRGGVLDRSFGTDGFVRVPGNARAVAVGSRGDAYVLSGEFGPNLVSHITSGGRLDHRFGVEGSTPLPSLPPIVRHGKTLAADFDPRALVAMPDGGVLVGGESSSDSGSTVRMVVVKLTAKGRSVPSFGQGGIAVLAFGRRANCNLAAMTTGPGGRVLLAGKVRTGRRQRQALAIVAIRRDGLPDRSFGTAGLATTPLRGDSRATAIAVRDGDIFVAGRQRAHKRARLVLLRFSADGRFDRRFARRVSRSWPRPADRRNVPDPRQVLPVGRDLVLVSHIGSSLTVFSLSGAYRGTIRDDPKAKPRERIAGATVQSGQLVVASNAKVTFTRSNFLLRRYQPR
jgi:uncharacterized delta-60 repeat protein